MNNKKKDYRKEYYKRYYIEKKASYKRVIDKKGTL